MKHKENEQKIWTDTSQMKVYEWLMLSFSGPQKKCWWKPKEIAAHTHWIG